MSTKNKLTDLRNHLFATLEALQDTEKPMDVDRAKAVAEVAKVVLDSAKLEMQFHKDLNEDNLEQKPSFFDSQTKTKALGN